MGRCLRDIGLLPQMRHLEGESEFEVGEVSHGFFACLHYSKEEDGELSRERIVIAVGLS